jgi:hypothetical protein
MNYFVNPKYLLAYIRKEVKVLEDIPEIGENFNKITILARQLSGELLEYLQSNEVEDLLKAHIEESSE